MRLTGRGFCSSLMTNLRFLSGSRIRFLHSTSQYSFWNNITPRSLYSLYAVSGMKASMTGHCDKWGEIWLKLIGVEVRRSPDSNSLRGMPVNPASPKFSLFSAFALVLLFLSHVLFFGRRRGCRSFPSGLKKLFSTCDMCLRR